LPFHHEALEMLIAAAAQHWNAPASECQCHAENSVITHRPSGRKAAFGAVAEVASRVEPPKDVKLKDPKNWELLGKSVKSFDIPVRRLWSCEEDLQHGRGMPVVDAYGSYAAGVVEVSVGANKKLDITRVVSRPPPAMSRIRIRP